MIRTKLLAKDLMECTYILLVGPCVSKRGFSDLLAPSSHAEKLVLAEEEEEEHLVAGDCSTADTEYQWREDPSGDSTYYCRGVPPCCRCYFRREI